VGHLTIDFTLKVETRRVYYYDYQAVSHSIDAAYCDRCHTSVCLCVCLCVGHMDVRCKNGWTDRDTVWWADSGGLKEPWIRWESRSTRGRGNFWGCPARWKLWESLFIAL